MIVSGNQTAGLQPVTVLTAPEKSLKRRMFYDKVIIVYSITHSGILQASSAISTGR